MINQKLMVLCVIVLLSGLVACSRNEQAANPYRNEAEGYYDAYERVEPIPLLTQSDSEFSYDKAYTFQEAFAEEFKEAGHEMMGYKLGLTGAQRPFGATEALYGRLFESMVEDDGVVELSDFISGRMELEMAFFFEQDVSADATLEQVEQAVNTVAPAVELPDLMFADMQNLSWLDLIALDVAPRQVIFGKQVPVESVDVNSITVQATYNGQMISEGVATNVMNSQWTALLFLADKLEERGHQIKAGDVVITGAMSGLLPMEPGSYDVNYGSFGRVSFDVVE